MENGDFEIIMEYPENEWIYGYLLSFGEHLKVKEPERIKKIMFEKNYKNEEKLCLKIIVILILIF